MNSAARCDGLGLGSTGNFKELRKNKSVQRFLGARHEIQGAGIRRHIVGVHVTAIGRGRGQEEQQFNTGPRGTRTCGPRSTSAGPCGACALAGRARRTDAGARNPRTDDHNGRQAGIHIGKAGATHAVKPAITTSVKPVTATVKPSTTTTIKPATATTTKPATTAAVKPAATTTVKPATTTATTTAPIDRARNRIQSELPADGAVRGDTQKKPDVNGVQASDFRPKVPYRKPVEVPGPGKPNFPKRAPNDPAPTNPISR